MRKALQIQYNETFDYALKSAANAGFKCVSLGFGSSDCFHKKDWEKHIAYISDKLNEYGIECVQTHLPYYALTISAEITDKDMDMAMLRCITGGKMLGAEWTAYHPRTAINDNYSPRKSMEFTKAALEPLVNEAVKQNTGIAIENLPIFLAIFDQRFFASDYEDICELSDYFNSENVGICWDFGHAHLMHENHKKAVEYTGDRIKATHIHNNGGKDDEHYLPSQGTIEWEDVVPALVATGYSGALTLEINYRANAMLESFFAHAYDCLCYIEGIAEQR